MFYSSIHSSSRSCFFYFSKTSQESRGSFFCFLFGFFYPEARKEHSVPWDIRKLSQTNGVASLSVWLLLTAAQQSDIWQLSGACALAFRVVPALLLSLHPLQWHHLCCTKSQPHPLRCQGALLGSPLFLSHPPFHFIQAFVMQVSFLISQPEPIPQFCCHQPLIKDKSVAFCIRYHSKYVVLHQLLPIW